MYAINIELILTLETLSKANNVEKFNIFNSQFLTHKTNSYGLSLRYLVYVESEIIMFFKTLLLAQKPNTLPRLPQDGGHVVNKMRIRFSLLVRKTV